MRASKMFSTDVLNEPIAETGLGFKIQYQVDESMKRGTLEALGTLLQMQKIVAIVDATNAAGAACNVVDIRTRRALAGAAALQYEIIRDAAPGRYCSNFFILELAGPAESVVKVARQALHDIRD
jgi:hypothetical protein